MSGTVSTQNETLAEILTRLVRIEQLQREFQRTLVALLRPMQRRAADMSTASENTPTTSRVKRPVDDWLVIHTDGSALGNGRKGARAGSGFHTSTGATWHGECPGKQSNQRAELFAAIKALEYAQKMPRLRIVSDSEYVVLSVNDETRLAQWRRNGWRTKARKPVANQDLWEMFSAQFDKRVSSGFATIFEWVKAHAGDAGNEAADQLAKHAAKRRKQEAE